MVHLNRLVGYAGGAGADQGLREAPVRSEVQVGEENLPFPEQAILRGKRFLDLHNHVRPFKNLLMPVQHFDPGGPVVLIAEPDAGTGLAFDEYLVATLDELVGR